MLQRLRSCAAAALLVALTPACAAPERSAEAANLDARDVGSKKAAKSELPVTNEALAPNQQFGTLDEYLAYLERYQGPVDGPWYRQVAPGVYELQTGNLRVLGSDGEVPQVKHTFTREELERKFGFKK